MILAAGLGTRLRPLTDQRPKALVDVGGRTMLEITLTRLGEFGIREVIVNVHHFADMIIDCLQANQNFGMRVEVSREDELLDTGGGLKKAAWFFREENKPFLVHNVDVVSTIDFDKMVAAHVERGALATLALQDRKTSRPLLFDTELQFCGRPNEIVRPAEYMQPLAFSGIHVISPRLLPLMKEEGAFSIISTYLRLAAKGKSIAGFRADQYYWRDLGKPESVDLAAKELSAQR